MELKTFNSTAILKAGYDGSTLVLYFTSEPRKEFRYQNVPQHIWAGLLSAHSKGGYYSSHIRDIYGTHPAKR